MIDNVKEVTAALAQFVISNIPANAQVRKYDRERFEHIADGMEAHGDNLFLTLESGPFDIEHRTDATLSIDRNTFWSSGDITTDVDGNDWLLSKFKVTVNWPCHGSSTTDTCASRLSFYAAVVGLARAIEAEFGGTTLCRLLATKEEKDAKAAAKAQAARDKDLRDYVRECPDRKRMRIGSERTVCSPLLERGVYTTTVDGKTYELTVHGDSTTTLKRTA